MKKSILNTFLGFFLLINSSILFAKAEGFVQIKNGRFERAGRPYFFMGANFWQGMNLGATNSTGNRALLIRELNEMKKNGISNLRILALSEGPSTEPYRIVPAVQNSPTELDEELLVGLDFLLSEMHKRNMTAVVCLSNFWPWSGGFAQWVSWTDGSSIPYPPPHPGGSWGTFQEYSSRFYTLPTAVKAQQESVKKIITRVNTITGVSYKDDSTIMSWELANEPRGGKFRAEFLAWVKGSAQMIKSLDKNHLVTIGSEGETLTPADAGNHFIEDHSIEEIDYATIHIWVENWGIYNPTDALGTLPLATQTMKTYIEDHVTKAQTFKKPVILEEFGMARDGRSMDPNSTTHDRDSYYAAAFKETIRYMQMNGAISGVNFWAWSGESLPSKPYGSLWKPGDLLVGDPPHEEQGWYGVYSSDATTLKIIKATAREIIKVKHAKTK
jgi:mannan endo-1,4-beta-mannosidase